jgi:hypothetical protein
VRESRGVSRYFGAASYDAKPGRRNESKSNGFRIVAGKTVVSSTRSSNVEAERPHSRGVPYGASAIRFGLSSTIRGALLAYTLVPERW